MKILFILDPLKELNVHYDSSLAMIRNFTARGHTCFFTNAQDIFIHQDRVSTRAGSIRPKKNSLQFETGALKVIALKNFDTVLARKEPPFNMAYIYMTYLLEYAEKDTLILNSPRTLRNTNEKLATLEFPRLMPQTLVSGKAQTILEFQSLLKRDLILKPLDERGGRGITVLMKSGPKAQKIKSIRNLSQQETLPIMAQEFLSKPSLKADKRVFLLEGKFLAAYERRFAKGDFRGNLSQGATHHQTILSPQEKKTLRQITPWLKRKKLHFVGLDLLDAKLLEINVTCPGGFPEADELYPELKVFDRFAESVERLVKKRKQRRG